MHTRSWRLPALVALLVVGLAAAWVTWFRSMPIDLATTARSAAVVRDPDNAIRGSVQLVTREPTTVVVTADAPEHRLVVAEDGEPTTDHEVPLLGLFPDTRYRIEVEVLDAEGERLAGGDLDDLVTLPLPTDELPPIEVEVAEPDRMTAGLTLFNSIYREPVTGDANEFFGYIQVVDDDGRIVWYHREPGRVQQLVRDDDGNFLYGIDEDSTRLMSPTGEILGEWRGTATGSEPGSRGFGLEPSQVIDLPVHSTHHETLPTDDGDYVTLSRVVEEVAYPDGLCEDSEPGDVENIVGDAVVVFDPETGAVDQFLELADAQDPLDDPRPVESDYCAAGYLDPQYRDGFQPRDWTHANAVIPIDDGRTWLVSARHTDSLWALRAVPDDGGPAGSLRWELGRDQGWEMAEGGQWFFHQHAPELQEDGSLLLYDNGNLRDDADQPYSRAVRYEFDPEARTIEQVWEHRMDPDVYASFVGDADRLDGTVLITHGGVLEPCELPDAEDDASYIVGRIVEVDEATNDIVWELSTDASDTCEGWGMYRAERIDGLYPAGWEVEETIR